MSSMTNRETRIERYVYRSALVDFLLNLDEAAGGELREPPPFAEGKLLAEGDSSEDLLFPLIAGDCDLLWPRDEDLETPERKLAEMRSELLAARLFATVAAHRDFCCERAAYFTELANRTAETLVTTEAGSSGALFELEEIGAEAAHRVSEEGGRDA